jgi:mRNA interferase RelE/StbE
MKYAVLLLPAAKKSLAQLPKADQKRADEHIRQLADNPRPTGCIKLSGYQNLWRIRVGNYRIIYDIQDQQLTVLIITIAHRRDVYRGL